MQRQWGIGKQIFQKKKKKSLLFTDKMKDNQSEPRWTFNKVAIYEQAAIPFHPTSNTVIRKLMVKKKNNFIHKSIKYSSDKNRHEILRKEWKAFIEEPESSDVETHFFHRIEVLLLPLPWDRETQLISHPVYRVPLLSWLMLYAQRAHRKLQTT